MKQWQLKMDGVRLQSVEVEKPAIGAGEVLVRMRAASLNYRDLLMENGASTVENGRVPLSDGAGEIVEIGASNDENWQLGERAAGTFFRDWQSGRFDNRYHHAALGGSCDGVSANTKFFPGIV